MHPERKTQDRWIRRQSIKHAAPQPPVAADGKHQPRHQSRGPPEAPMRLFVIFKSAIRHRISQCACLSKAQRKALSRNRVHRSCRIADQCNAVANHRAHLARTANCAARCATDLGSCQAAHQIRIKLKQLSHTSAYVIGKQRHTDFIGRNGRDYRVAPIVPMDLDQIGPWGGAEMLPEPNPDRHFRWGAKSCASPDERFAPIGTDDPAARKPLTTNFNGEITGKTRTLSPSQDDTGLERTVDEAFMKEGTPHAEAVAARKHAIYRVPAFGESNSAKRQGPIADHSKLAERRHPVGHYSFTTWLVDRWKPPLNDHHPKPALAKCDCCGQPCRSTADHHHVGSPHRAVTIAPAELLNRPPASSLRLTPVFRRKGHGS